MFTTKHYKAIAQIISDRDVEPANVPENEAGVLALVSAVAAYNFCVGAAKMRFQLVRDLIELFKNDNEHFNETTFLRACNISDEQWNN